MAATEDRIISKVVRTRDISEVLERGISAEWFADSTSKAVFTSLVKHYSTYGEIPSGPTVQSNFPTYTLFDVKDSVEYLIDTFVAERRRSKVYELIRDAVDIGVDPKRYEDVVHLIQARMADLDGDLPGFHDMNLADSPLSRLAQYDELKARGTSLLGVPTGFATIDRATAGLQNGQLVTIVASPKVGKSQLALKVAEHVHAQGLVPMFQSYEMSNLEQQQRFDALKAGISHSRLRRGALSHGEEHRYRAMLAEFEQAPDFYLTDTTVGTTVSSLAAKINQFNPDIVFVDGVYLMIDEHTGESGTPQALTSITRGLKRLAQRLDKPVVITTQALLWKMRGNRLSEGSIGYSSSVLQDSDVILGLEKVEDDETVRTLKILASRSCGPAETPLLWDWETGRFEEIAGDARASTEDDDDDEFDEYERVSA